ncbi:hypothetical protein [Caulobacter radicis]|uniref:hypothetical protein n=1 Tax=Caulobacter radicis TaxID=2172650 RepID=UPI001401E221|nr:hypothetical protein [Caulobacter radicis]
MLEYGEAFLEQNREGLKRLSEKMSPAAFAIAMEMAAANEDEQEVVEEELAEA